MATIRGGYAVQPHVQAFADWAEANYGIDSFGTYASHQPSPDLAVDCFGTRAEMLALAQACTRDDVIDRFGIDYVIHDIDPGDHDPGEIWNREIARHWREMADRGSPTQNHYDHVHVSLEAVAPPAPPDQEDDDMTLYVIHTPHGGFLSDGLTTKRGIGSEDEEKRWIASGAKQITLTDDEAAEIPTAN